MDIDESIGACEAIAARIPGLQLLVLFGSRARGDTHAASDWDFGWTGVDVDVAALVAGLADAVASDRIDLADLTRASAKLRFDASRDGLPVFEDHERRFEEFQLEAAHFWCDAGPTIQAANRALLADLGVA